jgi:hypothetical protein
MGGTSSGIEAKPWTRRRTIYRRRTRDRRKIIRDGRRTSRDKWRNL